MITHLLYLHGFRSSPKSFKAQRMAAWIAQHHPRLHWLCPQLPASPAEAMAMLEEAVASWPREQMAIVGSSLGGFYATVLRERLGCQAVVINPSVDPAQTLADKIGVTTQWHSEDAFWFKPEYIGQLRGMAPASLTQLDRYFALIATGDEVLDWRQMSERYQGAHMRIIEGSDHAVSDFDTHLPHVLAFLGLNLPQ